MSIDIYPKGPSRKEADFYIAKARRLRAEALREAGRRIAEDVRHVWRSLSGHRHA